MSTGTEFDMSTPLGRLKWREHQLARTARRLRDEQARRPLTSREAWLAFDTNAELVKVQAEIEKISAQ